MIEDFVRFTKSNHTFEEKRLEQEKHWLFETLNQSLKDRFYQNPTIKKELQNQLELLSQKKTTPYEVASFLLNLN